MKELEYPFDADYLLSKKKRIKKELLASDTKFIDKKIAILGGSTTANIMLMMELFLLNNGIRPSFYESEYNKYYEDAVFDNPELLEFAPDIIYVCTSNRNITEFPSLAMSEADVDALLNAQYQKFDTIWNSLSEKYNCPIIQNNFEMPLFRLMGNMDAWDYRGATSFTNRLNEKLYSYARAHENFYICDLNYIASDYGFKEWSEPSYWYMYKYAMCVPAIPYLSFNVANIIKSIFGKNKKGFVLDLDNTLWGGVIGDDGVDGIALGPEEAEGQAYTEFQQYLKAHQQLGIILNIDSKNEHENAIAGINHPDSVFTEKDFISIKANWDPKDKNFADIASELTLLPESLVFVDDNPAERHIVTEQLKGVCAPELDSVSSYIQTIDRSGFFETTSLSADDLKRNEMYQENAARAKLQSSFSDYGQYLDSLEMIAEIDGFIPVYMARIAQLTNKSNQFNLTTKRYTQAEIEATAADEGYITLYGKLIDKFGDNGVVSIAIGKLDGDACDIELWLMSCRVLKRDMEYAMMDEMVKRCKAKGVTTLRGHYLPTEKNKMVKNFYGDMGFDLIIENPDGSSDWKLDLTGYENQNKHIKCQ